MSLLLIFNLVVLVLDVYDVYRRPDSIFNFMKFCYSFIVGFGIIFINVMYLMVGYKFHLRDLDLIEVYSVAGYLCIRAGGFISDTGWHVFKRALPEPVAPPSDGNSPFQVQLKYGLLALVALSVGSSVLYLAVTGVSFGSASYTERYTEASGMGFLLLFIPAFLPYAAYRLFHAADLKSYLRVAFITLAYNAVIFVALNGYRQLLIGSILMIVIIGVSRGLIRRSSLIAGAILLPVMIIGLSFLRYQGETSSPFSSVTEAIFYYVQGDVFPIDAPLRIYWHCQTNTCPGTSVILSHLEKFVPRQIWSQKPTILLDSAGYYTVVVIGYDRFVTLSATILGEALLMQSKGMFAAIMFISGLLASSLTQIATSARGRLLFYVLMSGVYMGFFWVREGLEDAINRILILLVYFVLAKFVGAMLITLFPAQGEVRRAVAARRRL